MNLVPVDSDPFAAPSPSLVPVDHDPFASSGAQQASEPGFVANAARALRMGLPFGNQFVAAEKTVLPQSLGGSQGFDYGKNLQDVNAADARLQQEHPTIADLGQGTGAAIGALAVPAAALGEGAQGLGLLGRATRGGLTGAGLGAVQGAGAPGSDIRNLPQTEEGAIGGLYAGGALGAAFPAAGRAIGSFFSTGDVDPARKALVQSLRDVGINPTAGQITGNQGLQKLEASISDIPFGGGGAEKSRQSNSATFTKAILAKAGFPEVTDASPESLNAAHEALGTQFDALGARNAIIPDSQFADDMAKAVNDYHNVTGTPAPGIGKVIEGINGQAPGQVKSATPGGETVGQAAREIDPISGQDITGLYPGGKPQTPRATPEQRAALEGALAQARGGILLGGEGQFSKTTGALPGPQEFQRALRPQVPPGPEPIPMLDFVRRAGGLQDEGGSASSAPVPAAPAPPTPRIILGEEYNNLRSQLGKTAQKLRFSDPAQAEAYRGVQDALDSAMERSIAATNPDDLGAFQAVRQKYKNLVPIEQAAGSAGADAASGVISPQQMRTALAAAGNRRSYARGIGDLAPLTNAGNAILTNFPQSGTAPRSMMAHALQAAGGLAGGLGGVSGGVEGAGLGATAGALALPAIAGRAVMSRPGQAFLSRALAKRLPAPPPRPMSRAAMAAALAANADLQGQRNQATQP